MRTHTDRLHFTIATDPAELDQVHRINYRTFVEEIPQHPANDHGSLVDRFNDRSTYFVCKRGDRVIGMVALHEQRPFSLDGKLTGLDAYLPAGCTPCEIRLLAVDPEHRNGVVFRGLIREIGRHCIARGFDVVVISGTVRQLKLYRHLGFVAFGPIVGSAEAPYQPMYLTLDAYRRASASVIESDARPARTLRFTPGPVDMHPDVEAALALPAVSHRSHAFQHEIRETRAVLCRLTGARHAAILVGTGTLSNDVVAAQLATLGAPGLILSNGEFGERLVDHATRAGLRFSTERLPWGEAFSDQFASLITRHRGVGWVWMTHHETSTGALNDLQAAAAACGEADVRLCADCISSVGVVPVDLSRVWLATTVSGKGLASAAGLAVVLHAEVPRTSPRVPRYLDLSLYASADAVPFTLPSAQLSGLRVAATLALRGDQFDRVREHDAWLRDRLREGGFAPLVGGRGACPGMITLDLGSSANAHQVGERLARAGVALSYGSEYLRVRNWIQVALMGQCSRDKLSVLLRELDAALR